MKLEYHCNIYNETIVINHVHVYFMQFNHTLQEIHLQKLNLSDHDIELLVAGLIRNRNLLHLDLACNNISDYGTEALALYLDTSPPLKSLVLHHNHITDTGARYGYILSCQII